MLLTAITRATALSILCAIALVGCGGNEQEETEATPTVMQEQATAKDPFACLEDAGYRKAASGGDLSFAKADAEALRLSGEFSVDVDGSTVYVLAPEGGDYRIVMVGEPDADEAPSMSEAVTDPTGAANVKAVYFSEGPAAADATEKCLDQP